MKNKLVIGTRSSKLALWQANYIKNRLEKQYKDLLVEVKHITTTGDKILDVPLAKIGGKGLFTKELENEMLAKSIDIAVHSLKDMPTVLPDGLVLAAITERVDAGDALVSPRYKTLDNLPLGAKLGTSSLRRKAQLLHVRPDLVIDDLRGNVDTRLSKLQTENFDAIVLAVAGLKRLGYEDKITEVLDKDVCLPAVGQGALAIEARVGDKETLQLLSFLNDENSYIQALAERAFLRQVEGGCQVPVGVYAVANSDSVTIKAIIASLDGRQMLKDEITGKVTMAETLGRNLAESMLAAGGLAIMTDLGSI